MNKEQLQQKIVDMEKQLAELKKELEKKDKGIWIPLTGDRYYYIDDEGYITETGHIGCGRDENLLSNGNYFKRVEEAEKMANYLKYTNLLRKYVEEHSEPIDWGNYGYKYYLYYIHSSKEIEIGSDGREQCQGTIYASSEEVLREAIEFVGEKNLKKYVFQVEE